MVVRADAFKKDVLDNDALSRTARQQAKTRSSGSVRPRTRFNVYLSQAKKTPLLNHDELISLSREAYVHRHAQMQILSRFVPCVVALRTQYEHHTVKGLKLSGFTTGLLDQSVRARDAVLAQNRLNGRKTVDDTVIDEEAVDAHCASLFELLDRLCVCRKAPSANRLRRDLSASYLRFALRVDEFNRHVEIFVSATNQLRLFADAATRIDPHACIDTGAGLLRSSAFNQSLMRLSASQQSAFLSLASDALLLVDECGLPLSELLEMRDAYERLAVERSRCINAVVEANLLLAASEALRQRPSDERLFDLCQEANHGLMIAADRFSYWRNLAFSTYAVFWVRQRLIRDRDQNINTAFSIPCSVVTRIRKVIQARNKLRAESDAAVTSERIARELGTSRRAVDDALLANYSPEELDPELIDRTLRDPQDELLEGDIGEFRELLATALEVVAGPKRAMFEMLWGLFHDRAYTLEEVAKHFGLSHGEVRRAERDVLRRLKSGPFSDQLRDFYASI